MNRTARWIALVIAFMVSPAASAETPTPGTVVRTFYRNISEGNAEKNASDCLVPDAPFTVISVGEGPSKVSTMTAREFADRWKGQPNPHVVDSVSVQQLGDRLASANVQFHTDRMEGIAVWTLSGEGGEWRIASCVTEVRFTTPKAIRTEPITPVVSQVPTGPGGPPRSGGVPPVEPVPMPATSVMVPPSFPMAVPPPMIPSANLPDTRWPETGPNQRTSHVAELLAILEKTNSPDAFVVALSELGKSAADPDSVIPLAIRHAERVGIFRDTLFNKSDPINESDPKSMQAGTVVRLFEEMRKPKSEVPSSTPTGTTLPSAHYLQHAPQYYAPPPR